MAHDEPEAWARQTEVNGLTCYKIYKVRDIDISTYMGKIVWEDAPASRVGDLTIADLTASDIKINTEQSLLHDTP